MTEVKLGLKPINSLSLVAFDRHCLELSWEWLNDPETRELTMSQTFTRTEQEAFFDSLPARKDYLIWGVKLHDREVIGVAGLKNPRGAMVEYWGYIGAKVHWNRGLGRLLIVAVEEKARESGFTDLELKVSTANQRAVALYTKVGFVVDQVRSSESCLYMVKRGI